MKKSNRTVLIIGIVLVLVVLAGLRLAARSRQRLEAQRTGAEIQLEVIRGDITDAISETGAVEAGSTVNVIALTGGTVEAVYYQDGAAVRAGQVLFRLRNDDLDSRIKQARLSLEAAESSLGSALDNGTAVRSAELKVQQTELNRSEAAKEIAKLTVTSPVAGRITSLEVAAGDWVEPNDSIATVINDGELYLRDAIKETDLPKVAVGDPVKVNVGVNQVSHAGTVVAVGSEGRKIGYSTYTYFDVKIRLGEKLADHIEFTPLAGMSAYFICHEFGPGERVKSEGGSLEAADKAVLKAKVSAEVISVPVQAGAVVGKGEILAVLRSETLEARLSQAENEVAMARDNLNKLLSPDVTAQVIRVEQERLSLANLLQQAVDLSVVAPVTGTVTGKTVQVGDRFNAGTPVVAVLDTENLNVRISVDELEIGKIKPLQAVTVKIESLPDNLFGGEVAFISSTGTVKSGVATFDVLVRIWEAEQVKPGMTAKVTILAASKENVLHLPAEAVVIRDGKSSVRIQTADGPRFVNIVTGLSTATTVEVVSGLSEGDFVLLPLTGNSNATGLGIMGGSGSSIFRPRSTAGSGGV